MAKENITKFIDAAMTDKALATKLAALATENRCDFTAEELLEFGAARPLSDVEAEDAAGGAGTKGPAQNTKGPQNGWYLR